MKKIALFLTLACALASANAYAITKSEQFVKAAIKLQDSTVSYESAYRKISYPMGDVPAHTGVCSDVIIRAYRKIGIDLQKLVHEDMKTHFSIYPKLWGMAGTDPNIDHRRVPNLRVFFTRHGKSLKITANAADYRPGDIVTWNLKKTGSLPHIGIVTDIPSADGSRRLMMHNIGNGQVLEDMLFGYTITGHYRYGIDQ